MEKGEKGLYAILSKDAAEAEKALGEAKLQLEEMKAKRLAKDRTFSTSDGRGEN